MKFANTTFFQVVLTTVILFSNAVLPVNAVPEGFVDDGFAGLKQATGFNFAPRLDGSGKQMMLVCDKQGKIYAYTDLDDTDTDKEGELVLDLTDIICDSRERGLNSVIPHPDFVNNGWFYIYYAFSKYGNCDTDPDNGPVDRVSRFTMTYNNGKLSVDMNSDLKLLDTASLMDDIHNSGDLKFGKDGYLYLTIGDTGIGPYAENLGRVNGKIIRMTDTGGIPPENPFTGPDSARCAEEGVIPKNSDAKFCQEIYAYGFRNPFRFAFDPNVDKEGVERIYVNDVGSATWEDISELQKGGNFGWNDREGPCKRNVGSGPECMDPNLDDSYDPQFPYIDPVYWYRHPEEGAACAGGAFVPNGIWPSEYDGAYLFADYVAHEIFQLIPDQDNYCRDCNVPTPAFQNKTFTKTDPLPIQITFGPYKNTQALYYTLRRGNVNLRRIYFEGGDNVEPIAVVKANATAGAVGLVVEFDATESSDPDGDSLEYVWDFGDESPEATGQVVVHTYATAGEFRAKLTVKDSSGFADVDEITIQVGSPPTIVMESPAEGDMFAVGDELILFGSAKDASGNPLPDDDLIWEVRQIHSTHFHPFLDPTPGNNITLQGAPPPEDFLASTNSYLEVVLKVKEPTTGVTAEITRSVLPKTVNITFVTNPPGLKLLVYYYELTETTTVLTWENHQLPVIAPDQPPYIFAAWSDSGAQEHLVNVQPQDDGSGLVLIASFTRMDGEVDPSPSPAPVNASTPEPLPELDRVGNNGQPEDAFPLDVCQGDCDNDDDCAAGLVCFQRGEDSENAAGTPVPGCSGTGFAEADFCFDPNIFLPSPTEPPVPAPTEPAPTLPPSTAAPVPSNAPVAQPSNAPVAQPSNAPEADSPTDDEVLGNPTLDDLTSGGTIISKVTLGWVGMALFSGMMTLF